MNSGVGGGELAKLTVTIQADARGVEESFARVRRAAVQTANTQEKEAKRAADAAEREAQRAAAAQQRTADKAEREATRAARTQEREAKKAADAQERAAKKAADALEVEAKRAEAITQRKAAQIQAIEDRWLQREIRDRTAWEAKKDQMALRAAAALQKSMGTAGQAVGQATSKVANLNQSLMQGGRVVQDFTAGFQSNGLGGALNAISNNIEGMVMSLGGPAGLAGVLTIVGVAAMVAWPSVKKFIDSFEVSKLGTFKDKLTALEDIIKELEDKDVKLFIDTEAIEAARKEIDKLKEAHDALQRSMGKQTEEEQASGKAVEEALTGGEGRQAQADMVHRQQQSLEANNQDLAANQEEEERIRRFIKNKQGTGLSTKKLEDQLQAVLSDQDKIRKDILEQAKANVGGDIKAATTGVGREQEEARERLIHNANGVGAGKVAAELGRASPEQIEADEQRNSELESELQENEAKDKDLREGITRERKAREKAERREAGKPLDDFLKIVKDPDLGDQVKKEHEREAKAAAAERQKEIGPHVSAFGATLGKALDAAMTKHVKRGMTEEQSNVALRNQLARGGYLQDIKAADRPDVARGIMEKARERFNAKWAGEQANLKAFGNKKGPQKRKKPKAIGKGGRGLVALNNLPSTGTLPAIRPGGIGNGGSGAGEMLAELRALKQEAVMQTKILGDIKRTPKPGYAV